MPSTPPDSTHYVYLKFAKTPDGDLVTNTIPLKVLNISVSTTKTIPSFDIPMGGMGTGESKTLFFDLGMASKTISVSGVLTAQTITRQFSATDGFVSGGTGPTMTNKKISVDMTAFEISQLIHSMVDSSGFQNMQNISELIILMESKVDSNYNYRAADKSSSLIPFGYGARGTKGNLDNAGVFFIKNAFPDATTAKGLGGFVRSFNTTHTGEAVDVEFSLEFEVAEL